MDADTISFPLALQPKAGQGRLILEVASSHTMTHHGWQNPSGRVIGPSQRPLPDNTQQASMPSAEFEPAIPARGRSQPFSLDPSTIEIIFRSHLLDKNVFACCSFLPLVSHGLIPLSVTFTEFLKARFINMYNGKSWVLMTHRAKNKPPNTSVISHYDLKRA